ncbi:MAG: LysR family transcriptional regulator [Terricaulis sp.]
MKPRIIASGERAIGPGKADLLDLIIETGSISAAAKRMHMSYSRAWQLVDVMNHAFRKPLVVTATGGKRGGGAEVTPTGREVLERYRELQQDLAATAGRHGQAFAALLK